MSGRIRVEVASAADVPHLVERLGELPTLVSEREGRFEVEVKPDRESNRLLVGVLDAIEAWLVRQQIASATVHLGARTYTLRSPVVPA